MSWSHACMCCLRYIYIWAPQGPMGSLVLGPMGSLVLGPMGSLVLWPISYPFVLPLSIPGHILHTTYTGANMFWYCIKYADNLLRLYEVKYSYITTSM